MAAYLIVNIAEIQDEEKYADYRSASMRACVPRAVNTW